MYPSYPHAAPGPPTPVDVTVIGVPPVSDATLISDRPAVLLTRPADPFVARMTGSADRALKLLSLTTAGAAALAGTVDGAPICASVSLREALSELVWRGTDSAAVIDEQGKPCGFITVEAILAHGRSH